MDNFLMTVLGGFGFFFFLTKWKITVAMSQNYFLHQKMHIKQSLCDHYHSLFFWYIYHRSNFIKLFHSAMLGSLPTSFCFHALS